MANKIIAAVFMFIVVIAAQQVQNAVAEDKEQQDGFTERFKVCFNDCQDQCTGKGHGSTYCEMKCDADCGAKETAATLGFKLD